MNITELTAKPQLVKISISDEDIVEKYGDEVEFWVWDRQPMEKYVALAQNGENVGAVMDIAKDLILDDKGKPVISKDRTLPSDIAFRALTEVIKTLGK